MRIAITTWNRRKSGGAETYLSEVIAELHRAGHSVSLWHEIDEPADRQQIAMPDGAMVWSVADIGARRALDGLREWQPDLIYLNGLHDAALEEAIIETAPTVFFAHAYHGTCISGSKTFKRPTATPCNRRFGWQCLLHYYPRRCGGLNPITMMKQYRIQSKRLNHLRNCKAIATNSEHMRNEFLNHGIQQQCVRKISLPVMSRELHSIAIGKANSAHAAESPAINFDNRAGEWRLLFLGRMDVLKGGRMLLDALPRVCSSLDRPLRVTFAGDGPDRADWEMEAAKVRTENKRLTFAFTGWVQGHEMETLFANCDLLVMPSLWPEPFGLVGPEAGLRGVTAAAFAVGGINDWLIDGVNGHLASGNPPTAEGLAEAILKCLCDQDYHNRLQRGAVEVAMRFSMKSHVAALLEVFQGAAQ